MNVGVMASAMYTPLDRATREIRLAHLAPSPNLEEQPSCSLHVVSLDENPFYEALSYVWGDPSITAPIQLRASPRRSPDGADHIPALSALSFTEAHSTQWPVTTNLEAALRYLRHESEVRILWIDAICIDQSNVEEKNHQVPLMKSIYSNAEAVQVWLGPPTPGSADAIAILKHIGQGVLLHKIMLGDSLIGDDNLEPVIELMERPWWTRTWVRQEVILAKRGCLYCGFNSIDWTELPNILQVENLVRAEMAAISSGRITVETWERFMSCIQSLLYLQSMGSIYVIRGCHAMDVELALILALGRFCSNSDGRDSIYGFLGLMNGESARQIKPDYNMSVSEVFKDAAVHLMINLNSLVFLNLTTYTPKDSRLLPTWEPSWHTLDEWEVEPWAYTTDRLPHYNSFNACGNKEAKFKIQHENILNLTGIQLDGVLGSGIGGVMAGRSASETSELPSEWRHLCCADGLEQSGYVAGGKASDAFWRVLLGDNFPENIHKLSGTKWRRCQSKDEKAYQQWWNWWRDLEKHKTFNIWTSDLASAYDQGFLRTCHGCRFFVTKKGYFGMGPAELAGGDQVYVVAGGRVPLILRPLSGFHPNTFELVGDCYVHGVMDGEAVTGSTQLSGNRGWKKAVVTAKSIVRSSSKPLDPDLPLRDFHDIFIV